MVDLKSRLIKPRSLRGTPSYDYVIKLTRRFVAASTFIGFCLGIYFYKDQRLIRELSDAKSFHEIEVDRQEQKLQNYVAMKKGMLKRQKDEKEGEIYHAEGAS